MRDLRLGDEVRLPDDRTGRIVELHGAGGLAFVRLAPMQEEAHAVSSLRRVLDLAAELAEAGPELEAVREQRARVIELLKQGRGDMLAGVLLELVPELAELIAQAASLPAPFRGMVERMAQRIGELGVHELRKLLEEI